MEHMSDCIHETTAERRKAKRGGTEVIALQCLICGVAIREVAKDGRNLDTLDWFDPTIADEFEFRRKAEFERLHKRRTDEYLTRTGPWWEAYKEYLRSDHWSMVRAIVLERDPLCQRCFRAPSEQVHHLSYDTFSKFGFSCSVECVGLCADCHSAITLANRTAP